MQEVIDCMKRRSVPPGHELIKQGDTGDFFYVIERGTYDIYVHGQKVVSFTRGQSFGELALLYNCPRAATCQSKEASEVWSLDRLTFRHLLQDAGKEAIDSAKEALSTVDLLRELTDVQLERIAEAVKVTQFQRGDVIVNYGDIGEMFYMIKSGVVTCLVPNHEEKQNNRRGSIPITLQAGSYFGERALITNEPRAADCVAASDDVVCLTLNKESFNRLLGPMEELLRLNVVKTMLATIAFLNVPDVVHRTRWGTIMTKISQSAKEMNILQNEYIIHADGARCKAFYIIREGSIGVVDDQGDVVEMLSSGQSFNPEALTQSSNVPTHSYFVSSESADVFKITTGKFENALGGMKWKDYIRSGSKLAPTATRGATSGEATSGGTTSGALVASSASSSSAAAHAKERVMNPDNIAQEELVKIKILGEGTFGRVYLVHAKRSTYASHYALKVQQKHVIDELKQKKNIMNEKKIMEILDHPFILRLEACFQTRNCLNMMLEIVTGGELFDLLADRAPGGILNIPDAAFYTACVVAAFNHFWEKDIIYRDLKPENLMLDSKGYIKVVDYGFAKQLKGKMTHTCCGTLEYFAPELVRGKGYGKPVDIWGIGILLHEMLIGYTPFNADSQGQICKGIVGKQLVIPRDVSDPGAKALMRKILEKNPLNRYGCGKDGPIEIMRDSW
jgi:cGMP-dependent protein kinase